MLQAVSGEATLLIDLERQGGEAILDASDAACHLLGVTRDRLATLSLADLCAGADSENGLWQGNNGALRMRLNRPDGRPVDCDVGHQVFMLGERRIGLMILRDPRGSERQAQLKDEFAALALRLSAARTPREASLAITEAADRLFGWDASHVNLYPEGRDRALSVINIDTIDGVRQEFPSASPETPISPMSRRVLREGAQLILKGRDSEALDEELGLVTFGNPNAFSASLMYVPIRKGRNNVGVLSIQSYQHDKYSQEDLAALQTLADQSSDTFERLLAEEALHRQIQFTRKFAELGQQLNAVSTPEQVAEVILKVADDLFGWDACYVTLYDEEEDLIRWIIARDLVDGKRTNIGMDWRREPPGPFFREVLGRGAKLILRGSNEDRSQLRTIGDDARRSASLMFTPVRFGTRRVGLLSIQSYRHDAYTPEDLQTFQALADHCSGALTRSFAEDNLRRSEARLRLVTSQIPTVLWSVDRDLNLTLLLGEALADLGIDPSVYTGKPLRRLLEPDGAWESGEWMHERALLGHSGTFELTLGSRIFHSHVEPLQEADGTVIGCVNVAHDVTALRIAEEEMRKFKMAIEQAPGSVVIINAAGVVEYVNPAFERQTGYTREETVGRVRPFQSIGINSGDFYPELKRRLDEGLPYNGVVTAQRKNGNYYFEGKVITPLTDAQGNITHYVETGKDITEKLEGELARQRAHDELEKRVDERTEALSKANKQLLSEIKVRRNAEQELERSLSLLRATLESTTDGIMVVDLAGHLVSFNQKWLQMWSISFSLAEDLGVEQLHHLLANQLKDPSALADFKAPRSSAEAFQLLELLDGRIYECSSKASMIGGMSVGRVWCFRDITRRRRDEEALARSEQIYREAIENASGVPYRWDYKGKHYDFMGEGIRQLLGLEPNQATKQGIESMVMEYVILDPDFKGDIRAYRRSVREGKTPQYRVDLRMETITGEQKWVNDCSVPMRDPKTGEIVGTLGILQDITARKKAEEEARVQQERLIQSEKLVALGTLVSGVAHEINNPNNFIMLNTPLLHDAWTSIAPILEEYYEDHGDFIVGGLDFSEMRHEVPKLTQAILSGAQRIRTIVQELRDFARPNPNSAGEPVDVNSVVKSALILLQNVISNSTTRFSLDCNESLPAIMGNFQRLEQVVINLIQNACQALDHRDQPVAVRTWFDDSEGFVVIEVADGGRGISPEHLKQITDPFFTTKRDSGGTGLGLSISSNIVHNHGGLLEFSSTPGEGTIARAKFRSGQGTNPPIRRPIA
ncbi:PAS domain S-box protein [bacterium]|nr:PAS domain S-box protein [bacterium]